MSSIAEAGPRPRVAAEGIGVALERTPVLRGVSLDAADGETVGLIGPNGSGKTTLLRTLYRALRPDDGRVALDGDPVGDLSARQVARRLAVVVQEPATDLAVTVRQVVLLGRAPHRSVFEPYRADDHATVASALADVGCSGLVDRWYRSLSGGERQRVLIARAIAQGATTLLLDEPTNHLDVRYQHEVLRLVCELPTTAVVVLHDLNLAARYCDRLVLLDRGRVAAAGPPWEVCRPETIEAVYGVRARLVVDEDRPQLVFGLR